MNQLISIASFELKKMLFNRRGIIALVAFALVWALILLYPVKSASSFLIDPNFKEFITSLVGQGTLDQLFKWKVAELAIFWIAALYLFPLFSIFIAADQFASDKARGTLRFITLRASRDSLFFGRFAGVMVIQILLLAFAAVAAAALALYRDAGLFLPALFSSSLIIISITIVLLPYTALMALLSLNASSARQATIQAILLWAGMSVLMAIINSYAPALTHIQWIIPGAQVSSMINTLAVDSLAYAPIPILQALVLLVLGRQMMQRSSL